MFYDFYPAAYVRKCVTLLLTSAREYGDEYETQPIMSGPVVSAEGRRLINNECFGDY
jgi:hypothetical protein